MPNSDPDEISSMNRGDRTGGKAREKIYYISIKMGCSVTLYISNELLVEFDWSNSAKSSLDGLFERISKIGTDVIILDGVNLLANLGKLFPM